MEFAAVAHLEAVVAAGFPSADPYLGLAGCHAADGPVETAMDLLRRAERVEPDCCSADAVRNLTHAVDRDPDLHQARFGLARALTRLGRRTEAAEQARELLRRLPPDAPKRPEVVRLLAAVW